MMNCFGGRSGEMGRIASAVLLLLTGAWCYPAAAEDADTGAPEAPGLRAHLRPRRVAVLSSELAARIEKLELLKGDRFRKGNVLVAFDCRVEKAKLGKAQARMEVARKTAEVNKRLAELDSISILEVEKSLAEVREAEADIAVMEAVISKCVICAPFSGVVSALHARPHQFVSAGQQLLEILDDRDLEVELLGPSQWLLWLKPGKKFYVRIEETGKKYPAQVIRIGASIDPVSQTVEIMGKIDYAPNELIPGMSGDAFFD